VVLEQKFGVPQVRKQQCCCHALLLLANYLQAN
jgi:hypothetical protein